MGDWYEVGWKEIEGRDRFGFLYANESTGYNEIFVEFTQEQEDRALAFLAAQRMAEEKFVKKMIKEIEES